MESENGKIIPGETVLTAEEDLHSNHCLDYFLQIIPNTEKILNVEPRIVMDEKSVVVEKFLIEGRDFTQLSDHFGISGKVKVHQKKENLPDFKLEISK